MEEKLCDLGVDGRGMFDLAVLLQVYDESKVDNLCYGGLSAVWMETSTPCSPAFCTVRCALRSERRTRPTDLALLAALSVVYCRFADSEMSEIFHQPARRNLRPTLDERAWPSLSMGSHGPPRTPRQRCWLVQWDRPAGSISEWACQVVLPPAPRCGSTSATQPQYKPAPWTPFVFALNMSMVARRRLYMRGGTGENARAPPGVWGILVFVQRDFCRCPALSCATKRTPMASAGPLSTAVFFHPHRHPRHPHADLHFSLDMSRDVIDVDSRDDSPMRARPGPRTRSKGSLPAGDVIELTDSEEDMPQAGPSKRPTTRSNSANNPAKRKGKKRSEPAAGPSRVRGVQAPARQPPRAPSPMLPLFLPDLPDDPQGLAGDLHFSIDFGLDLDFPPAPAPLAGPVAPAVEQHVAAVVEQPAAQPALAREPVIIPDEEEISFDTYVAQVLEIIPDVLPAHVFSLIEQRHPTHKDNVVEAVLHLLIENPDYPKVDVKGKGKRKRDDSDDHQAERAVRLKVDYGDKNRKADRGLHYASLAIVSCG